MGEDPDQKLLPACTVQADSEKGDLSILNEEITIICNVFGFSHCYVCRVYKGC